MSQNREQLYISVAWPRGSKQSEGGIRVVVRTAAAASVKMKTLPCLLFLLPCVFSAALPVATDSQDREIAKVNIYC